MSFYQLPSSLPGEILELEEQIRQFQAGQLDPTAFKARRVPFGIYEQRKDNTFMVRVRCPGGAITPRQLRLLAELSQTYGAQALHITTRQELQIHDVSLDHVIPILQRLLENGLSTRGGGGNTVRNITTSSNSGVAPDEPFDVSPYVFALTNRLIAEPDSWLLPRKYKIAFSNTSQDSVRAILNDLGFIATERNGRRGFAVYVAGGQGTKPQVGHLLHDFVEDSEVFFVAEAIKRLFHQYGNRKNRYAARLRFLWNSLGEKQFVELYHKELGELHRSNVRPLDVALPVKSLRKAESEPNIASSQEFQQWRQRYVEPQKQPGLFSVLIPISLGNLSNADTLALADFLVPLGEDVLRATIEQNLQLRNIPVDKLEAAFRIIQSIAPLAKEPRLLGSIVACTGAATCKLGLCLPRGALSALTRRLKDSRLDLDRLSGLRIHLSGCPNSCGAHMTADLGFFGRVARVGQTPYPAYEVVAGAKLGHGITRLAESVGTIAARDVPAFVEDVLQHYVDRPASVSFSEYFEHQGKQELISLCKKYQNVPSFEEDKNYYFDWGATEVFSVVGRGIAECSAGLFDLIEVDLSRLKELRLQYANTDPKEQPIAALQELTLLASRMLLITRGVEAESDLQVFELFYRHFIEAGLVDARFAPLLQAAAAHDDLQLKKYANDAFELSQTMEELYGKMDNSLHFPGENTQTPPLTPTPTVAATKDFRSVLCPMNFVKTKLALEPLSKGQRLRVLLDDGAPIQNVPRSVAEEGHRIIEQIKIEDHWAVLIEKR